MYFYSDNKPAFGEWLRHDIAEYGLRLEPDYRPSDKSIGGSDNVSFARKDIPIIWYHTGRLLTVCRNVVSFMPVKYEPPAA